MAPLLDWTRSGGLYSLGILALGALALVVAAERLYVLVARAKLDGRLFIEKAIQLVRSGKIDEAIRLCASSRTAIADVGLLILRSRTREEGALDTLSHAAALSLQPRLTRRLGYLPMLATAAALLGVLAAVHGVSDAYAAAAGAGDAAARGGALAAGIARALKPAALGIAVAIPVLALHNYLCMQADVIIEQLDEFSVRLVNALADRPDVRLGHR
jgi:biopolymer transport protein ExbB/TolQ